MTRKRTRQPGGARAREGAGRYAADRLVEDFLDYYRREGHTIVPSAPLRPDDPTLLFTAAGMVPFKSYYSDPGAAPYPAAASAQKCLRAGGKQSDLENVGRTLRHHTFFEMLGNFSFGDYFKRKAIETAWDLSVDVWKMDPGRIWISVYKDDDEAFDLWAKRIGVPKARIVRLGKKDNFWGPVGDTGVCGPSSELYYDTGRDLDKTRDSRPGDDDERFIEYWNLVFPQFFYTEAGAYDPLPKPGIDTGLGLERLAFILQGVEDNFHTDLFLPIRRAIQEQLGGVRADARFELALNAASDHLRALVFAISEGIYPANEGRGYVLRRLLRRAVTKMHPFGANKPLLAPAVDVVADIMGDRYPEVRKHAARVSTIITAEEEHFLSTIEQGWARLQDVIEKSGKSAERVISGEDAFVLYDTFGFPLELTTELAVDAGLRVDEAGYRAAMAAQKERSRTAHRFSGPSGASEENAPFEQLGTPSERTEFVGYEALSCEASIEKFRIRDGGLLEVTTDRTVFYPVGGGQVGDTGRAAFEGRDVEVIDAFRDDGHIVHVLRWEGQDEKAIRQFLEAHRRVQLEVDRETRLATARNHTGTHLLHKALRDVLGEHVTQAGSLVAPDRLRFDFNHFQPMTGDEIARVERIVNDAVLADLAVSYRTIPFKQAISEGAMALFGEKYGADVRMVTVEGFSKELCGGTHLARTGEIGVFVIAAEGSVAAGVRRIEALTGRGALDYLKAAVEERDVLAETLKAAPGDLVRRVRELYKEVETLHKKFSVASEREAADRLAEALETAEEVGGVKLVTFEFSSGGLASLRRGGDLLRERMELGIGLLCLRDERKPVVLVVVSERLIKERDIAANTLAGQIGKALDLRGGGKPHMAQLGITSPGDFEKIKTFVRTRLEAG